MKDKLLDKALDLLELIRKLPEEPKKREKKDGPKQTEDREE